MYKSILHKFSIEASAINYNNGNSIDLNKSIISVAIHKDYISNAYPLYHITFKISKENKKKLIKNPFYISLKIFRVNNSEVELIHDTENTPDTPITDKLITQILLRPYNKSKLINSNINSDIDEDENTENDIKEKQFVEYSLNCIPLEQLRINNKILNCCYSNSNMNETVLNCISEVYTNNIYYQESNNINRYDSLLIPQMSLIPALHYLQNNYGLYNNMLNLFFDDYKLFVYDIKSKTRKFNNIFNIVIENTEGDQNQAKYSQILVDDNKDIKKILNTNPLSIDNSEIKNYEYGDTSLYNSYDDNFNLVTRKYNSNNNNLKPYDKKIRIHWNSKKEASFEKRDESLFTNFMQLTLNNIDPSLIDPDTKIIVYGSDVEENNGEYSLINKDIYYTSKDNINFDGSIIINLGKK